MAESTRGNENGRLPERESEHSPQEDGLAGRWSGRPGRNLPSSRTPIASQSREHWFSILF